MLDTRPIASGGLTAAVRRLDAAARTAAELGTPANGAGLPPAARVDLSGAARDLIEAKAAFGLNAAVFRAADRMTDRLLDVSA